MAQLSKQVVLYLEPHKGEGHRFAQCGSCRMFLKDQHVCSLHGKDVWINSDDSCGLFVPGGPAVESEMEHVAACVTPEESGLIKDTQTRCENCSFGGEETCQHPALGFPIVATGCCNAFKRKSSYVPMKWTKEAKR